MTARERALTIRLSYCTGQCAGDALLCVIHEAIRQQIAEAEASVRTALIAECLAENDPEHYGEFFARKLGWNPAETGATWVAPDDWDEAVARKFGWPTR